MLALIAGLITWTVGDIPSVGIGFVFNIVWKLFDMSSVAIQAFIFALLTVLYFGMAGDTATTTSTSRSTTEGRRRLTAHGSTAPAH